jgi:CubicO group peptidase (beta-lactamase class C family)
MAVRVAIARWVSEGHAVGVAVGVMEPDGTGRMFFRGSAGVGGAPLGPHTVFEIGSISKVLTATLLADLAERGALRLDDPISAFLPAGVSVPPSGNGPITFAHLATHSSGLPFVPPDMPLTDLSDAYADYGVERLWAFLTDHRPTRDPGVEVEYSNAGIGLLGHLLGRVHGSDYESALWARVLGPLGMTRTAIDPTPDMRRDLAVGHDPGGVEVPHWGFGAMAPAGGLHSTVTDMMRFLTDQFGPVDGDRRRTPRFAQAPRRPLNGGTEVGLAWVTETVDGRSIVYHEGGTSGHRSFIGFDPDRRVGVVVLANSAVAVDPLARHILDPTRPLEPPRLPRFAGRIEWPFDATDLDRYVGDYRMGAGRVAIVDVANGRLYAMFPDQPPVALYSGGSLLWFARAVGVELRFDVDETGRAVAFAWSDGREGGRATRVR